MALVGDSGVGKSTLARALADTLELGGATVRFALGTQTGSAIPLGAFFRSVMVEAAHEPAAMLAAAHKTLEREEDLVVIVDDAQLLDPLSSTLVHQLAASGCARLIVTIRSGEPVPDAVTVLLKERLLLSLRIEAFTREQTEALARAVLGGVVDTRLITELHERAAGSPLLLRGLLGAGRESGVLVRRDAGWQLRGALRADRQLYDLLEFRLQSFAPEELEAVEVLAAAEVLDWGILRGLCDADAVGRLERRGVIQVVADGFNTVARLHHPLMAEVAIRHAGVVRTRQLNGMLAQHLRKNLQAEGQRSRLPDVRAQIQLAQFMMRSDLSPDLDLIIDAAASAMTMSNFACGEELARFAFDRGGGLPAAIVLGKTLSWQGRGDETEAVIADVDPPDGADEWLIVQWGGLRALNLFINCGRVEPARQVLADVKNRVASEAVVGLVTALEVSFGFFSGDVATTIETGPSLCRSDVLPMAALWAAVATSSALALAGRFGDVHRIAEAGLRAAALERIGIGPVQHGFGRGHGVDLAAGTFPGGRAGLGTLWRNGRGRAGSRRHGGRDARGRPAWPGCAAVRVFCLSRLDSGDVAWFSVGLVDAGISLVRAGRRCAGRQRGRCCGAAQVGGRLRTAGRGVLAGTRAGPGLGAGRRRRYVAAQTHAVRAAQIARQSGMYAVEMRALHTAVRFDDRSQTERLAELAKTLNTSLAEAIAQHARGLAGHDGDVLDAAADRFADMGAVALAADAAAQAAREHARTGQRGKEMKSSTRAHWLARQHEIRTPAVHSVARPLPITDREREIVMLAAAGLSNRQIAQRLSVSVRTVEGHVYRIFAKLGIEHREQLIHLVGGARFGM